MQLLYELTTKVDAFVNVLDDMTLQVIFPNYTATSSSQPNVVDIWAIGCIAAELMLGKPLFKGKE